MFEKFKYHLLMHFIIFIWGFTGILGKLILLPPTVIVWYRIIIATVGLFIVMKIMKIPIKLGRSKDIWKLMLVGFFVSMHWVTFYMAISLSTASLGILCLSTATLHVTWLEPIIMKRKFSRIQFLLGLIVIYGIYFVSSDFDAQRYEALGYGLVSALFAALFSVSNAKLAQTINTAQISFYELLVGIGILSLMLLFAGKMNAQLFQMRWEDFAWLLFLGLVCTTFAFVVIINVVKRLGTFTVSLSINLEPVYTILLAIVILNEDELLGNDFYVGSSIIIIVVIANAIIKHFLKSHGLKKE
jgi:drug/metabolite transporter (DMT)-like permease